MTRLGTIVQEALDQLEWHGELTADEAAGTTRFSSVIHIQDQPCELFIDTHEESDFVGVFYYPPFRVKTDRYTETCLLINAINTRTRLGHLEILRNNGRLRMVVNADVEGASPTGVFVRQMMRLGADTLSNWMGELAAVALSNRSADDVLAELEQREEQPAALAQDEAAD